MKSIVNKNLKVYLCININKIKLKVLHRQKESIFKKLDFSRYEFYR